MPIIQVKDLTKEFFVKKKKDGFGASFSSLLHAEQTSVRAVDHLTFSVEPGECLAFIGPNGAGKSTTIKMLTGILYPTSGQIDVLGFNPSQQRTKLSYHISSVFGQKPQLWYHLPAIDTYRLLSKIYELDCNQYQKRLQFLVETFEIQDFLEVPVRQLSLGQRMRCEIVASLLHQPKIIFLDEPTIGLDVIAKQHIRNVIRFFNEQEKVTIFLTSHDSTDIEELAKRTMVINFGKIIFDGTTEALKARYFKTKVINLIFNECRSSIPLEAGRVLESDEYHLKVEWDISKAPIETLLHEALNRCAIRDMTIEDPSMDDVIANIYREKTE